MTEQHSNHIETTHIDCARKDCGAFLVSCIHIFLDMIEQLTNHILDTTFFPRLDIKGSCLAFNSTTLLIKKLTNYIHIAMNNSIETSCFAMLHSCIHMHPVVIQQLANQIRTTHHARADEGCVDNSSL